MREDLGTWTPAQAEALRRVLADAGIEASTETAGTAGPDVRVTVASDDSPRAGRVMAARMEEIAAAATRANGTRPQRWYEEEDDEGGPPLLLERFRRMGGALAVLVAGLMVAIMVPGPFRIVAAFLTFGIIVAFIVRGRRKDPERDDRTYGPGS